MDLTANFEYKAWEEDAAARVQDPEMNAVQCKQHDDSFGCNCTQRPYGFILREAKYTVLLNAYK